MSDPTLIGTQLYWESQCRVQREALQAAKEELAIHVGRVASLELRLQASETYLNNFRKRAQSNG